MLGLRDDQGGPCLVNLNRRDAVSTRFESRWAFHRKIGQQIQERKGGPGYYVREKKTGSHESKEPGASPNFFDLVAANHFSLMYSQVAAHATMYWYSGAALRTLGTSCWENHFYESYVQGRATLTEPPHTALAGIT